MVVPGRGSIEVLGAEPDSLWHVVARRAVAFFRSGDSLKKLRRCLLWQGGSLDQCDVIFQVGHQGVLAPEYHMLLPFVLALASALEGSSINVTVVAAMADLHDACDPESEEFGALLSTTVIRATSGRCST